ncbi:hypothetical protein G443_001009 [Actinoalloteichus cyanogriseus DSM 43889]|uniref:Uncharacterized protein n=2 Tax=Actinoalloteichus cyanogriseus TaxID=2893586 RepID=A0ABT1JEM7_ACTCY|nr:hypothetical protein [Actinoalloteichus caeruleus DSM 43889]
MSRFLISDLAAEMHVRASRYDPERMTDFASDLGQWGESIAHLALALATFTRTGQDRWPLNPAVIESLARVYQPLGNAAAAAAEMPATFRGAHAVDLHRAEAPRPGENKWNV